MVDGRTQKQSHFERGVFEEYPNLERKTVPLGSTYYVTDIYPHGCSKRTLWIDIPLDSNQPPRVYADGPDGIEDSPHRYMDPCGGRKWLCLWYPGDPPERQWKPEHGLLALLGLARIHLTKEGIYRRTGEWPGEEVPH